MWHCCPASACVLQPPGIRALAVDMGREGRSRRNSSRPGRWARSLDVGEGTTADEETSSHEPHEPMSLPPPRGRRRHTRRYCSALDASSACSRPVEAIRPTCRALWSRTMLQRSILLSSRQVYQCRATQAIPVQGPLLDKDVAARLRTLARWVQRPPPLTLFGRPPQDQPKSVITVLPVEAMVVDAEGDLPDEGNPSAPPGQERMAPKPKPMPMTASGHCLLGHLRPP